MAVVQNRFGIHPLVEGSGRQVHPKTTTFCPVLGFTPSRQPSRAHQSQNDLEQLYSGPFWPPPVFPMCHIRKCPTCLPGRSVALPGFPDVSHPLKKGHSKQFQLLMCDIRKSLTASVSKIRVVEVEALCFGEA